MAKVFQLNPDGSKERFNISARTRKDAVGKLVDQLRTNPEADVKYSMGRGMTLIVEKVGGNTTSYKVI